MQSDAQALIAALRSALERKCSTSATAVSAATAVSTALLALCGAEEGFSDDELTNLRGGLDVCAKNAMDQRAKRVRTMAAAHSASLCVSLRGVALPLSVCTTVIAQFVAPAERCRTLALVSRDWREVAGAPEAWPALYGFRRKYNIGLLKAALAAARFQRLVALELPSMCQGQTLWRVVMDACPHLAVIDAGSLSGTASRAHSERLAAAVCSPLSIVALRLPDGLCSMAPALAAFSRLRALSLKWWANESCRPAMKTDVAAVFAHIGAMPLLEDLTLEQRFYEHASSNALLRVIDEDIMLPLVTGCRRLRRLDLIHVGVLTPLFWRRLREEGAGAVALESVRLGFGELAYCGSAVWAELPAIAAELVAMKPLRTLTFDCGWERWGSKQAVAAMPDFFGRATAAGLVRWANDAEAPTKPVSGFIHFCNANRAKVDAENPEMKMAEKSKVLGAMWKEASEEARQPFMAQNEAQKVVYAAAMKEYGSNGHDASGSLKAQPAQHDLVVPEVLITEMRRSPASFGLELHELERQPQPYKNHRRWTVNSVLAREAQRASEE